MGAKKTTETRSPREAFRHSVREQALAVATEQIKTRAWSQVRIGDIANEVGVSRPTIYAEFGNKEGLGKALVMREVGHFMNAINQILEKGSAQPIKAVEKAIRFTIAEGSESGIVRAVLSSGAGSEIDDPSLLPLVTIRATPMIEAINHGLYTWFSEHSPGTGKQDIEESVDALTRLVVSNLVSPGRRPNRTIAKLSRTTQKLFPNLS